MPEIYAPLQKIDNDITVGSLKSLHVLRLDQLSPTYTGNKQFKLKYNIQHAKEQGYKRLVSFGGAYSNHIHALALAGKHQGMPTVGIIRGERTTPLNPTLSDAEQSGMILRFVSRHEYRLKHDVDYLANLQSQYNDGYIIPEGGSNIYAVQGCMEILNHIHHYVGSDYDIIILPCGTAATMAGIVAAVPMDKRVLGISVLKNATDLNNRVEHYLQELGITGKTWTIEHSYHCGGYAKINKGLVMFMKSFQQHTDVSIEPIYTGKMFYALKQLIENKVIDSSARVIAIHTGGLQGLRGMSAKIHHMESA